MKSQLTQSKSLERSTFAIKDFSFYFLFLQSVIVLEQHQLLDEFVLLQKNQIVLERPALKEFPSVCKK